jgi:hypothetical protein
MLKHKLRDLSSGETIYWTLEQIIEDINRDRSEDWIPYTKDDWREGWQEWCEGVDYHLIN